MTYPIRILLVDDGEAAEPRQMLDRLSSRYETHRVDASQPPLQLPRPDLVEVVLLPPGTSHEVARRVSCTDDPLSLWWTDEPDPALDIAASQAGLHGAIAVGANQGVEAAFEAALARHSRLSGRPRSLDSDAEQGWDTSARWRWTATTDQLILDANARLPLDRDLLRAVIAEDIRRQRHQATTQFLHAHLVAPNNIAAHVTISGTLMAGSRGAASMQGTITCSRPETIAARTAVDPLTGLPSRETFLGCLSRAAQTNAAASFPHAVVCFDLDNLHAINDALGHRIGDLLLQWAAARVDQASGDAVAARVGSDEFAVLLPHGLIAHDAIARRLLDELSTSVSLDGQLVYPSAKAGLAWYSPEHTSSDEVLRDAQSALTRAKSSRTSRLVTFHDEMRETHRMELQLDRDLRQAVASRAFDLYFQPIVRLDDGHAVGFEALVRWPHPTRGIVSPASFIPLAERTGLIIPLGFWVLDEACRGLAALHRSTPGLRNTYVTVNISPLQLHQADFVRQVLRVMESHNLSPGQLRLEITEDSAMSNAEATIDVLRELRAAGIQILIDDFGTGYSALHYLVRLPADVVKVDRSFVDGVGADPRKTRVITTIVDLADSLGMRLVAEGVETLEQLDWLGRLGFQDAQGYYFARPMPWRDVAGMAGRDLRQRTA